MKLKLNLKFSFKLILKFKWNMKVKFTFELKIVNKNRLALIGHHTGKKWWKLSYVIANI